MNRETANQLFGEKTLFLPNFLMKYRYVQVLLQLKSSRLSEKPRLKNNIKLNIVFL